MRKINKPNYFFSVLLLFAFLFSIAACKKDPLHPLTVTNPSSESYFAVGAPISVDWEGELEGTVNITIVSGFYHLEIANSVPNSGSYSFDLPSDLRGNNIQILVQRTDVDESYDYSDMFKVGEGGGTPTTGNEPTKAKLLAHFPLDGDLSDVSENGHSGSVYQTTPVNNPAGQAGKALFFNGGAYGFTNGFFDNLANFSVSFWINPYTYSQSASIIYKPGVLNVAYTSSRLVFQIGDGEEFISNYTFNSRITSGSWQHVTITMQGKNLNLYVNGYYQESGTIDATLSHSSDYLYIGGFSSGYYYGSLDELMFYDGVLTEQEVYKLYTNGTIADLQPSDYNWINSVSDKQTLVDEDFSSNAYNWSEEYASGEFNTDISSGIYKVTVYNSNTWIFWPNINDFNLASNFQFEAKVRKYRTSDSYGSGLYWGNNDFENYYYFSVSNNRSYKIDRAIAGEVDGWTSWTTSDAIDEDDYNKLTVRKVSSTYYFFINETLVETKTVTAALPGKYFSVMAEPNSTIYFDDFSVYLFGAPAKGNGPVTKSGFNSLKN